MTETLFTTMRRCPACNSENATGIGQKNDFQLVSCQGCETVYAPDLPSSSNAQDYDAYCGSHNLAVPEFVLCRIKEIVAEFAPYRSCNRLLDIGFGAGTSLKAASCEGWNTMGVEISKPAIEHAKNLGFSVFHGELREAHYPDGYFDVVIASEVLEHLPQPRELIQEVSRILRPGGVFWATTPHSGGISYRLLSLRWSIVSPPEHLQVLSKTGVKIMLSDAGFRNIHLCTHGLNPMEIIHVLCSNLTMTKTLSETRSKDVLMSNECFFDRVTTAYKLNEMLMRGFAGRAIKGMLNGVLNSLRMGDSLKIRATL